MPALAATGVGLPAAIAVGAGLSAAEKKLKGGSWGDALKAGAMGAATSAIPGAVGGLAKGAGGAAASAATSAATKAGTGMDWGQLVSGLLKDPNTYANIGSILGSAGSGKTNERLAEGQQTTQQNQQALSQYGIQQGAEMQAGNLDLSRKAFETTNRGQLGKQALIGDLLANFSPTSVNVPGIQNAQISGGLKLGQGGQDAAKLLNSQALQKMLNPDAFTGGNVLQAPELQQMPQAGGLEKFLQTAGLIGSVAGGVGKGMQAQPQGNNATAQSQPQGLSPQVYDPKRLNPDIYQQLRF